MGDYHLRIQYSDPSIGSAILHPLVYVNPESKDRRGAFNIANNKCVMCRQLY